MSRSHVCFARLADRVLNRQRSYLIAGAHALRRFSPGLTFLTLVVKPEEDIITPAILAIFRSLPSITTAISGKRSGFDRLMFSVQRGRHGDHHSSFVKDLSALAAYSISRLPLPWPRWLDDLLASSCACSFTLLSAVPFS